MVGIFQTIKSKRMFYRILALLLAMVLGMFLLMFFFLQLYLSNSYQQQMRKSSQQVLSTASEYVDLALLDLGRSMQQLLWNTQVTKAVLLPNSVSYGQKVEIAKLLSTFKQDNPLVQSVYLLSYTDAMLYAHDGTIQSIKESDCRSLLPQFSVAAQSQLLKDDYFSTQVISLGGDVALLQNFPTPENNGALMAVIETDELFQFLGQTIHAQQEGLAVRAPGGSLIFSQGSGDDGANVAMGSLMGDTGWTFESWMDAGRLHLGLRQILELLGIWAVLFGTISILAAVFITLNIYRPIGRLRAIVEGDEFALHKQPEDELTTVERIYQTTLQQRQTLSDEVERMAPIVRERLYKNLIKGRDLSDAYLTDRLANLKSPLTVAGSYFIVVAQPRDGLDGEADEWMSLLYQRMEKLPDAQAGGYVCMLMDDYSLVLIVSVSGLGQMQLKSKKQSLLQLLESNSSRLEPGLSLLCGSGQVYGGIKNLSYSYRDALEQLNYLRYHGETALEIEGDLDVQTLLERSTSGNLWEAERELEALLQHIQTIYAGNEGRLKEQYTALLDHMVENLIRLQATDEKLECLNAYYRQLESCAPQDLEQLVRASAGQAITLLANYGQRNKNRYIMQAKKYIEEHSGDSALSLDAVGEVIGINGAYLSRLFYELSDVNFVNFVNQCRTEKAKALLRQSSIPVTEVGYKTGFNSLQNFNRVFKRHTGMTPGAFRKGRED